MKFLELFIGAIILWIIYYSIGKILFQTNKKISKIKLILTIFIFSILLSLLNIVDSEIMHGVIKIAISYILFYFYYKILFNKQDFDLIVGSLILYLSVFISETIIAIIMSVILKFMHYESMIFLKNTIFINALVNLLAYTFVIINKNRLAEFTKNSKFNDKGNILIILIMLITISLLGFKIPLKNWTLNIEFIMTMFILISFCIIGVLILKQKSDIQKTKSMYQQLVEYSNITNDVLEEYRVVTHEHKNQLLIIRSMLENKDKDINDYVDSLLEKREGIKYKWIGELNHLPLSGLKGLINYKVLEMESLHLNKIISISKEVSKLKLEKLSLNQKDNLYSIIGVYLDNAIQASKESIEKEINIEIYKEKKELVIIIANTYSGKIEMDKLDNYGYTTKGKNHGIGLHIVKNILKSEPIFNSKTYLLDNYFVKEIRIDLKQIKSK